MLYEKSIRQFAHCFVSTELGVAFEASRVVPCGESQDDRPASPPPLPPPPPSETTTATPNKILCPSPGLTLRGILFTLTYSTTDRVYYAITCAMCYQARNASKIYIPEM